MIYSGARVAEKFTGLDILTGTCFGRPKFREKILSRVYSAASSNSAQAYKPDDSLDLDVYLEEEEPNRVVVFAAIAFLFGLLALYLIVANFIVGIVGAAILVSLFKIGYGPFLLVFPAAFAYFLFWNRFGQFLMNFSTIMHLGKNFVGGYFFGVALALPAAYLMSRYGIIVWGDIIHAHIVHATAVNAVASQPSAFWSSPLTAAGLSAVPGLAGVFIQRNVTVKADKYELEQEIRRAMATRPR